MHQLSGTRFGTLEYDDQDLVTIEEGLIGFPECRSYLIIATNPEAPFRWLQSVDDPAIAFLVADPSRYVENYAPEVDDELAAELGLTAEAPAVLFTTVRIPPGKPREMTLNLAGPIVLNLTTRRGRQLVIDNEAYTMRYRVFPDAEADERRAA